MSAGHAAATGGDDGESPEDGENARLSFERLLLDRRMGDVRGPTARTVANLHWRPSSPFAIERDNQQQFWFSGHVSALLSDGAVALVATDTGGAWIVNPRPDAIPISDNYEAIPLSDDWDEPNATCLAYAPGASDQFFVGCGNEGAFFFIELQVVTGGMEPKRTTNVPLPLSSGGLIQILVVPNLRRVVLACGNGIWWSPLPSLLSNASGYSWTQAVGLPFGGFSGLAAGPSESVVAAAWGANVATGLYGMFVGQWNGGNLVFSHVPSQKMHGVDATRMLRTSLTSCDADPSRLYAVAAGADDRILAVLASSDGGNSWTAVTAPDGGFQGSYANCIAVSPFRPEVVVVGWTSSGPFFSNDGGLTWSRPHTDGDDNSLHADFHALYFTRNPFDEDHLFAGHDGGVITSRDLGKSWNSQYNKHLQTLQFYGGQSTASSRFPGLIAGGTQDNGNIYCNSRSGRPSWKTLEGGDGGPNRFLDALGGLLRYNNTLKSGDVEFGNRVRLAFWNAATESFDSEFGTVVPVDGDADGLPFPFLEAVASPAWSLNGKLMYAVAAKTRARSPQSTLDTPNVGKIYGFFANRDGSGAAFTLLADIGELISGLASRDGSTVLVGLQGGRIVSFDCASRRTTELGIPAALAGTGSFIELADLEPGRAFALHSSTQLLHFNGSEWTETAGSGFVAFAADPRRGSTRIFAATDTSVFASTDNGDTWANASDGLPSRPHCSDLRLAADGNGGHDLYLATYGRSVWTAKVDIAEPAPIPIHIPAAVAEILAGVLGDGGGIIQINGQILKIPPRSPVRDILGALAIDAIAQSLSPDAGREIRLAALRTVRETAEVQIRQLASGH